jgi:hypothetical protein
LRRASSALLPVKVNTRNLARYAAAAVAAGLASSRIELGSVIGNILARASVCLCLYVSVLWFLDQRLRRAAAWSVAELRARI